MMKFLLIYILCILDFIASGWLFVYYLLKLEWICLLFIVTLVLGILFGGYARNQYGKMYYGVKGENRIYKYLVQNLKGYKVYKNVQLEFNGKEFEIDIGVVGKKGVCIIEVKNYRGEVYGHIYDHDWLQVKKIKDGKIDKIKHKNPIQQLHRQKELLSAYFKKNKIDVFIYGFVYIQCDVIHAQEDELLTQPETLLEAIQRIDNQRKLSHKDKKEIQRLLKS